MSVSNKKAQKIAELLEVHRGIARLSYRHIRHTVSDSQLSMAGVPILKALYDNGALPQHAIAENLCVSDAAVSRQVKILAKDNLIAVQASRESKRVSLITLTDKGLRIIDDMKRSIEAHFVEVLDEMPEDEIDAIVAFSERMLKKLNERCEKENE